MEGRRNFNRIKIFTLDIFNQRKFKQAIAINRTNQCWNLCKPGQSGGPPATLAGDNAITIFSISVYNNRLQHAMNADGLGKLANLIAVENIARLLFARLDLVERNVVEFFEVLRQACFGAGWFAGFGVQESARCE